MYLTQLGWNNFFQNHFSSRQLLDLFPARVSEENRGFYRVLSEQGEFLAQLSGKFRFRAETNPVVGDWVAVKRNGAAMIEAVLPRKTSLSRKTAGRRTDEQLIAANVDTVFIVSSMNQDLNFRRLERYLTIVWDSGARPVILLNKADLAADPFAVCAEVESVAPGVSIHPLSAKTGEGMTELHPYISCGLTVALIGSSGVGKSTIINALTGLSLEVQEVRESDDSGSHTTTTRQMIVLNAGGILIDTPGMRELQLLENENGISNAFADLESFAENCKFRDCTHRNEPLCAVIAAVESGLLSADRLQSFHKLQAELNFVRTKTDRFAANAKKQREKRACRTVKSFKRA